MKKWLFFIGCFVAILQLQGQHLSHFNKALNFLDYSHPGVAVIELDYGYSIYNTAVQNGVWKVCLIKTDENLNILHTSIYERNRHNFTAGLWNQFHRFQNNGFVGSGTLYDVDSDNREAFLAFYNTTGDLDTIVYYNDYVMQGFNSSVVSANWDILGAGWARNNASEQDRAYLTRVSSDGNLKWTKLYGNGIERYNPFIIRPALQAETFIISAAKGPQGSTKNAIMLIDSLGNILLEETYPSGNGGCIVETSLFDSSYVVSGYQTNSPFASPILRKVSQSGDLLWEKLFSTPISWGQFTTNMIVEPDGRIIVGGRQQMPFGKWAGIIACISPQGDSLWQHEYQFHPGAGEHQVTNLIKTSDGGYLMSGYVMVPDQRIWLLKVDSMGCERAFCEPLAVEELPNNDLNKASFTIYPNPSSGEINIKMMQMEKQATIVLYNLQGKEIMRELLSPANTEVTQFHIKQVPGMYLLHLVQEGKVLKSEKIIITQ